MEVLLEVGESRREIRIVEGQDVAARIEDELRKTLAKDVKLTCRGNTSDTSSSADEYVLQRWSQKWNTYVDVEPSQVSNGDRISVVLRCPMTSKV